MNVAGCSHSAPAGVRPGPRGGLSVAAGALCSGGLIAADPFSGVDALVVLVLLTLVLQVTGLVAVLVLMVEAPRADDRGLGESVRATPRTVAAGIGLLRSSPVLLALVAVELFWGFGMVCFENLLPVRLADVLGGTDPAAAVTRPGDLGRLAGLRGGSAALTVTGRWLPIPAVAALMRVVQGVTVAAMGLFSGVVAVLVAYLATPCTASPTPRT